MESMLQLLEVARSDLPRLLWETPVDRWGSLNIDYEHPFVERLWIDWVGGCRINLHCIAPCEEGKPLFHPHPWPSAMEVIEGAYEMGIGADLDGRPDVVGPLPIVATMQGGPGFRYEMTNPAGWHYVRSRDASSLYTLMITGAPWGRHGPRPTHQLQPLMTERRDQLMKFWRDRFRGRHYGTGTRGP